MENIDNPKFGDSTLTLGFKVYFSMWIGGCYGKQDVESSVDGGNRRRQGGSSPM